MGLNETQPAASRIQTAIHLVMTIYSMNPELSATAEHHISPLDLEDYYCSRITPAHAVAELEQHLFHCGRCLDTLNAIHQSLKTAGAESKAA